MDLNWLAPAFDDAKSPLKVSEAWIIKVAVMMSVYIPLVIYPFYAGLRYFWAGVEPTWQGFGIAVLIAVAFGFFAHRIMSRYFHVPHRS